MQNMHEATRAYAATAARRSLREQEAEIFHRVIGGLRRARELDGKIAKVRALADNDRLWIAVVGLAQDPANALPPELRAALVSVGFAVQREMQRDTPDLDFLIAIDENVAAGLSGPG